jgi:hypothetical protein
MRGLRQCRPLRAGVLCVALKYAAVPLHKLLSTPHTGPPIREPYPVCPAQM